MHPLAWLEVATWNEVDGGTLEVEGFTRGGQKITKDSNFFTKICNSVGITITVAEAEGEEEETTTRQQRFHSTGFSPQP